MVKTRRIPMILSGSIVLNRMRGEAEMLVGAVEETGIEILEEMTDVMAVEEIATKGEAEVVITNLKVSLPCRNRSQAETEIVKIETIIGMGAEATRITTVLESAGMMIVGRIRIEIEIIEETQTGPDTEIETTEVRGTKGVVTEALTAPGAEIPAIVRPGNTVPDRVHATKFQKPKAKISHKA